MVPTHAGVPPVTGLTESERRCLWEALEYAIQQRQPEERKVFGEGKSCQLAAWESILPKRPKSGPQADDR
jgi:hypothetical protein